MENCLLAQSQCGLGGKAFSKPCGDLALSPVWPVCSWVTLSKLPNFSEPQFSRLKIRIMVAIFSHLSGAVRSDLDT